MCLNQVRPMMLPFKMKGQRAFTITTQSVCTNSPFTIASVTLRLLNLDFKCYFEGPGPRGN